MMIHLYIKLIGSCARDRRGHILVGARDVWVGQKLDDFGAYRVPAVLRDHPLASIVPAEFRAARHEWVKDRYVKEARFFLCRRNHADSRHALSLAQTFIIGKPKRTILHKRSADRTAKLVALSDRLRITNRIEEEVVGIESIVAKEFINAPADVIPTRFDCGVNDGSGASSKFGRIA